MVEFNVDNLEKHSFYLGMIYAFAEVVGSGVKRLGLSPPLDEQEYKEIIGDTRIIADDYGLELYTDKDFIETILFNPEYTRDKIVIHLADSSATLEEYMKLKEHKKRIEESGELNRKHKEEIAWRLGRLLSYSDEVIENLIEKPRF